MSSFGAAIVIECVWVGSFVEVEDGALIHVQVGALTTARRLLFLQHIGG